MCKQHCSMNAWLTRTVYSTRRYAILDPPSETAFSIITDLSDFVWGHMIGTRSILLASTGKWHELSWLVYKHWKKDTANWVRTMIWVIPPPPGVIILVLNTLCWMNEAQAGASVSVHTIWFLAGIGFLSSPQRPQLVMSIIQSPIKWVPGAPSLGSWRLIRLLSSV
jgi:hypothetical protein